MRRGIALVALAVVLAPLCGLAAEAEEGFTPLFNGTDLTGWTGATKGYVPDEEGNLVCKGGGNLLTAKKYSDFIFRFEFKLTPGANNGLGIRLPEKGHPSYAGMELQILDNSAEKYAKLRDYQYHGSIYGVVPAKRGHQKPIGEWNTQEVIAKGKHIRVNLNGAPIVGADLTKIIESGKTADGRGVKGHQGITRSTGRIGFLGHGSRLWFRNLRIKELGPDDDPFAGEEGETGEEGKAGEEGKLNTPPEGFVALFNGKDLSGWKGLVGNPKSRAKMSDEKLAAAQKRADANMRKHWSVEDGALVFDAKGHSLCTAKDYRNFEMYVDWKIQKGGDSGIYLRGTPQVQIWDYNHRTEGSGGLFNNKKNPSKPLVCADNPIGKWNTFTIKMIGERVTVKLNGKLVVDNVVMENYWERDKPIYPTGQIELQSHGSTLYFRNIYLRELPDDVEEAKKAASS